MARNGRSRNRRSGLGRYTPLLRDPSDSSGGWIVWDSHRQRPVRSMLGTRVFRGRRGLERADSLAYEMNRRG